DRDLAGGQRLSGRALLHTAVLDGETALVARTGDGAVRDAGHRAALVGAFEGERLEGARGRLGDHDLVLLEDLAAGLRDVRGLRDDRPGRLGGSRGPGSSGGLLRLLVRRP